MIRMSSEQRPPTPENRGIPLRQSPLKPSVEAAGHKRFNSLEEIARALPTLKQAKKLIAEIEGGIREKSLVLDSEYPGSHHVREYRRITI